MAQASLIYGWQFAPSYFDVVVETLKNNPAPSNDAPMEDRLAPVAVPMPSTTGGAGVYDLKRISAPPPLVEGALYGQYIPKSLYPSLKGAPDAVELAWKDDAKVFIPGTNFSKGEYTDCWFFPMFWTGRVSDKNQIAALPLLGFYDHGTLRRPAVYGADKRPPFTPRPIDAVQWVVYTAEEWAAATMYSYGNHGASSFVDSIQQRTWEAIRYDDDVPEDVKDALRDFPNPDRAAKEGGLPTSHSPYIVPNVSWPEVVEYMERVYGVMRTHYSNDVAGKLFADFGSPKTGEAIIRTTVQTYQGSSRTANLKVSFEENERSLTWWGMAHTEWLEANKTAVNIAAIKEIARLTDKYIHSIDVPWDNTFRSMSFPFKTPDGPAIVRGAALRVAGSDDTMTKEGRAFYSKYIEPIIEATQAGFTAPTMTLDEAKAAHDDAKEVEKALREASGPQGDASKNLTKARQEVRNSEEALEKAREKIKEANEALEKVMASADYKKWEKLEAQRNSLLEMDIDVPDDLTKKIAEAAKVLGNSYTKAKAAAKKGEEKLVESDARNDKAYTEEKDAEALFDKVKADYEDSKLTTEQAQKTVNILIALESHLYLPSYGGYAQFLHDVRQGYDPKTTSGGAVGGAFRWFSGSPQAAAKQSGRWSADSEWAKENAARNSAAASAVSRRPTLGGFGVSAPPRPTRVVAGPVDIYWTDGSLTKFQAGRPSKMVGGSYVTFDDLGSVFGNEFGPLFDAYKAAYPDREVDEAYANIVFEVTETAKTNDEGRWVATVQPVAIFDQQFTPIAPFEAEVKDVPFGETEITIDPDDPFVMIPAAKVKAGVEAPAPKVEAEAEAEVEAEAEAEAPKAEAPTPQSYADIFGD